MSISTTSGSCSATACATSLAVGGLADDRDVLGAAEHHRQPGADERVVVDDQDADRPVTPATAARRAAGSRRSPSSPCSSWPPASVGPLGQADEAGAGARDLRSPAGRTGRAVAHARSSGRRPARPRHDSSTAAPRGVLARVGQRLLDDPVARCARSRRGRRPGRDANVGAHASSRRRATPRRSAGQRRRASAAGGCGASPSPGVCAARRSPRAGPRAPGARWPGSRPRPARPPRAARPGGTRARRRAGSAARSGAPARRASRARSACARRGGPARRAAAARPRLAAARSRSEASSWRRARMYIPLAATATCRRIRLSSESQSEVCSSGRSPAWRA